MELIYMIAILPPPDLSALIDDIRKQCSKKFGVYKALKPPVHITLAPPFKHDPKRENKLIEVLQSACYFEPFIQQLENFDGFPSSGAVYISANKSKEIQSLYRNIKKSLNTIQKQIKGSFEPHLTIAYKDTHDVYPSILEAYKNKRFKAKFLVSGFTLLKHNGQCWNIVKYFECNKGSEQLVLSL